MEHTTEDHTVEQSQDDGVAARNRVAMENIKLLHAAITYYCRSTQRVTLAVKLCGSVRKLAYVLMPEYLKTVGRWLRGPREYALSTFVYKMVYWKTISVICQQRLIKLPESKWHSERQCSVPIGVEDLNKLCPPVVALSHKVLASKQCTVEQRSADIEAYDTRDEVEHLMGLLKAVSPREHEVLELRFMGGYTLGECAKRFGITKERIRQLEAKALHRLRRLAERQQRHQ